MFLIPVLSLLCAAAFVLSGDRQARAFVKPFCLTCICEYAGLFLIYRVLRRFAADFSGSLPVLPLLVTCMFPYAATLMKQQKPGSKLSGYIRKLCIASAVIFLAELFIMNGKSLTGSYRSEAIDAGGITCSGEVQLENKHLRITGDATLTLEDVPDYARCLVLPLKQKLDKTSQPYTVKLSMQDDNFPNTAITVQEKKQMGRQANCRLSFRPYGEIYSLTLSFSKVTVPITLKQIQVGSCLPFRFLSLRFFILLALTAFVTAAIDFSWYLVCYDRKNQAHRLITGLVIAACMLLCFAFSRPGEKAYDYSDTPSATDPYALTFDAFQKGQVFLDITPDEGLDDLENVYSPDERKESEASVLWDYTYYDGKYYCYFGVTPVLLYYYPFYLLNDDKLPALSMAITFFSVWSVLFFCLAVLTAIRMFIKRPNLILTLLSLPCVTLCVGIFYMMNYGDKYHLPFVSGLCMLSICLLTGMKACMARRMPVRMILLFLSGASLALTAGARPSLALSAAVLIPLFIGILVNKRQKPAHRIGQAACFLSPLFLGTAGLMWYNQARFGSVFDFGAAYQLTVSDIHANRLRLTHLWGMLSHYFCISPQHTATFPFFEPQYGHLNNYQQFVYLEGTIGWMMYPMVAAGLLLLYPALSNDRVCCRSQITRRQRTGFLLTAVAAVILIAWMDFSAGGVNQRYLYDIAPLLLMLCTVTILRACPKPRTSRYPYLVLCMTVISTGLFGALYMLGITSGNLVKHCPNLYNLIEEMVMFWQ